jgi:2-oxoglutarate dehydrogenase E2 component (dihydrolipoamide succinyltransferase)
MLVDIKIPSPGESISEVEIGKWLVENGSIVRRDQEIAEVESDKATLSLLSTVAGQLTILLPEGERIAVGSVACTIDTDKSASQPHDSKKDEKTVTTSHSENFIHPPVANVAISSDTTGDSAKLLKMTPAAKAVMESAGLSITEVQDGMRRLNRQDMESIVSSIAGEGVKQIIPNRVEDHVLMSPLRRKLSQRLVAVKNETAMLTTFNEVDMSKVMEIRNQFQKAFTEKYGCKLGYNALFTKAVSLALGEHNSINSMIDGAEIVTPRYHDIGIAVSSPKGLLVPVLRNVETMSVAQIELAIKELADKARDKRLTVEEMSGGTFTITNGGVFGSMMSTPILNPPQSAILGLHAIKDRPVAIAGKVEIRPMMYIALSYDHRIIDGKDSVGFLVKVKDLIENPTKLILNGKNPEEILLGL